MRRLWGPRGARGIAETARLADYRRAPFWARCDAPSHRFLPIFLSTTSGRRAARDGLLLARAGVLQPLRSRPSRPPPRKVLTPTMPLLGCRGHDSVESEAHVCFLVSLHQGGTTSRCRGSRLLVPASAVRTVVRRITRSRLSSLGAGARATASVGSSRRPGHRRALHALSAFARGQPQLIGAEHRWPASCARIVVDRSQRAVALPDRVATGFPRTPSRPRIVARAALSRARARRPRTISRS